MYIAREYPYRGDCKGGKRHLAQFCSSREIPLKVFDGTEPIVWGEYTCCIFLLTANHVDALC